MWREKPFSRLILPILCFCHPFADAETTSKQPLETSTAKSEASPASFANGRNKVTRFLGEGGKKRVYVAQDTLLNREVAFALIKTETPTLTRE